MGGTPINKPNKSSSGGKDSARNRNRYADTTRVNERIRSPKIRVVLGTGEQLGIMNTRDALERAKSMGLDLVEVATAADPPVCRIIDYGRYKYEQAKLQKSNKSKNTRQKEVKFRVGTGTHDYNIKMARAESFLAGGHKVRIQLQFKGRENAHQNLGFEVMNKVIQDMKTVGSVDQAPRLAGRSIGMVLTPLPEGQRVLKFKAHLNEELEEEEIEDDVADSASETDSDSDSGSTTIEE